MSYPSAIESHPQFPFHQKKYNWVNDDSSMFVPRYSGSFVPNSGSSKGAEFWCGHDLRSLTLWSDRRLREFPSANCERRPEISPCTPQVPHMITLDSMLASNNHIVRETQT